MKTAIVGIGLIVLGCTSLPNGGRVFLDSSTHRDSPPEWVRSTRQIWEEKGKTFIRASHTIRGDERVRACFDLARLDGKEHLLTELATEVRGRIDNAEESLSENTETILGKVRSGEFGGRVIGLRTAEEYYERYLVNDVERIDCHTLSEMQEKDYKELKRSVISRITDANPRLKEAIVKRQIDFIKEPTVAIEKE